MACWAVPLDARSFIDRYADSLGVAAPTPDEVGELLDLAGAAAHASERMAAPVSCWLAARAGISPREALAAARELAASLAAGD